MSLGRCIAGYEQGNFTRYGNMACLLTSSGAAALMAFFPFSGWKDSFFGDLHAQSLDGIEFYTQKKVVIERWPKEWSRKF
jgi:malonate-semialdehyde dehydrogenase (acetylating)/methylmalonate-semialdehyde dehydrogenase